MPVQQGGLLEGLDVDAYKLEYMMYPMWWVSSEGALLLTALSVAFFLFYSICCPARAGECSLNINDAPSGGAPTNVLLMSSAGSQDTDPSFMQLPRSYDEPRELPVVRPPPSQKRITVKTSVCQLCVRIVGDPLTSGRSIVTLHDAGAGAAASFDTMFRQLHAKAGYKADQTCIYHISLPGHGEWDADDAQDGAATAAAAPADDASKAGGAGGGGGGGSGPTKRSAKMFPGVDELSMAVTEVIKTLKMGFPVGLGVGVGADILLRAACRSGSVVSGLVLVDVAVSRPNVVDRTWLRGHAALLRALGHNIVSTGFIANRCFTSKLASTSSRLMTSFRAALRRVPAEAVATLVTSTLDTVPLLGSADARDNLADLPIMLLVGTGTRPSPLGLLCRSKHEVDDAVKLQRLIGYKSRVSITRIANCRRLVTEEDPHAAVTPFLGFLNGVL